MEGVEGGGEPPKLEFSELDRTRKIYERMFDLRIVTPQIVLNYAAILEEHGFFERARDLFDQVLNEVPEADGKPLYLRYAKSEEDHGLSRDALAIYKRAVKAVADHEKLGICDIYIAQSAQFFEVSRRQQIYKMQLKRLGSREGCEDYVHQVC